MKRKEDNNITTLDEFIEKNYGEAGTMERDELDAGYENFKSGALLQEARRVKGINPETCRKF